MSSKIFEKEFNKKLKHFKLLSHRRYNVLWENNDLSFYQKIKYGIQSNFSNFYFDDKLPLWRRKIRSSTKSLRHNDIDFFILSPIKVGSSQLALTLFSNPLIVSPVVKEFQLKGSWNDSLYYPLKKDGNKKVGFIAPFLIEPNYRKENFTLNAIKKNYPKSKLIIALRNPIKRAYSHWKWEYFLGGERNVNKIDYLQDYNLYVNQALKFPMKEPTNFSGFPFLKSGMYSDLISKIKEEYNVDDLYFLDMDKYFNEPKTELKKIQQFIGLGERYNYPEKLPFANENPIKFDKSNKLKETDEKLQEYYYDDIMSVIKMCKIGNNWINVKENKSLSN